MKEGDHKFLGTCPKHGGGYKKNNPALSKPNSLQKHPKLNFAEKRLQDAGGNLTEQRKILTKYRVPIFSIFRTNLFKKVITAL